MLFQFPDEHADGRLREMDALSRARKPLELGDGQKSFNLPERDIHIDDQSSSSYKENSIVLSISF
ncbi:MAG: hypothetical protein L0Y75_04720 [Acidobacteria bacterium]|nr:hypothetical protein [Acidobacteriota bacterium]